MSNLGGTGAGTAVSGIYAYDMIGRTTTLPSLDAAGIGSHATLSGDVAVGYYANDYVHTQTQGGDTLTFTLDPTQDRVVTQTDSATGVTATDHYGDGSDSPVWTVATDGTRTRYLLGPGGDLAGSVDQTGTIIWDVVNPHGDVVGQIADDTSATPLSFSCSTEYGAPRDTATAYDSYGWLGGKRRSSNDLAGLTLMGVRLYNPATGRFLTPDPIPGGNPNAYIYPTDPNTMFDLNGQWGWHIHWKSVVHSVIKYATVAATVSFVGAVCLSTSGLGCAVTGAVLGAMYGGAAQIGAAKVMHERVTGRKVASWMFGSSFGAGRSLWSSRWHW